MDFFLPLSHQGSPFKLLYLGKYSLLAEPDNILLLYFHFISFPKVYLTTLRKTVLIYPHCLKSCIVLICPLSFCVFVIFSDVCDCISFCFLEEGPLWALVAQLVKNPPAMRETWVQSLGWEDPLEKGPTPVFWPGAFHGLYSPRGRKELDTTEWLSLSLSLLYFPDLPSFYFSFSVEMKEPPLLSWISVTFWSDMCWFLCI